MIGTADAKGYELNSAAKVQKELRKFPRNPCRTPISLQAGSRHDADSVDLSVRGIGLASAVPYRAGQPVEVAFFDRSVVVKGIVRHAKPTPQQRWRIGIEFLQQQHDLLEVALKFGSQQA